MSNPKNHHYVPVFYLSRWLGEDGRVCRFSRPFGAEVKAKRIVPKGTAFEPNLYSVRGKPEEIASAMESKFMSPIDSKAAIALGLLEAELPDSEWEPGPRSDWSRFIWAQSLRTPQEIQQLKSSVKEAWSREIPELEAKYQELRSDNDPPSVDEYLAHLETGGEDYFALGIARRLMDHPKIGQIINNMNWVVLRFEDAEIPLLTSDRPVWMTAALTGAEAFMVMPIGPTRLFVAAPEKATLLRLKSRKRRQQAKDVNKLTVQHATQYVYGIDDKMLSFVDKHMSTKRHSTHIERIASMRNFKVVDSRSPAAKS